MEGDIKYEFEKITNLIEEIKRTSLREVKEKLNDLDPQRIKITLEDIKNRLERIENKIQK